MTVIEHAIDLSPTTSSSVAVPRPTWRKVAAWLLLAVLVAAWFVTLRPVGLGGPAGFILVSGESMEPKYHTGDLVVTRNAASYREDDIVAYVVPEGEPGAGGRVIHRIIGGDDAGYVTKGDNTTSIDAMWHPSSEDVIGKAWFVIPRAGLVTTWLRTPLNVALVLGFIAFLSYFLPEKKESEKASTDSRDKVTPTEPPGEDERRRSGPWPQPYWP